MKRLKTIPVCVKCGKIPVPDPEKSTENWKVYPFFCPDCGGNIKMSVQEGK